MQLDKNIQSISGYYKDLMCKNCEHRFSAKISGAKPKSYDITILCPDCNSPIVIRKSSIANYTGVTK